MLDRRTLLASAVALTISAGTRAAPSGADARLAALLQSHVDAFRRRVPEAGGDPARLGDRSLAAMATDRAAVKQGLAALAAFDPATLSPRAREDLAVARFVYATLDDMFGRYGFVDIDLRPSPYVVSQMNGAYYWLPEGIGRQAVGTPAERDGWLARLAALGTAIDQESARIAHDAGIGVIPPDFVIDRTIAQLAALRDAAPAASPLLPAAARRTADVPLDRATDVIRTTIAPAITRQIAALQAIRARATDTAGVWHLPQGEAYYAAAARANTTTDLPPSELHRIGLAQVADYTAQLDTALRAQGYAAGSVGTRIAALNDDKRFLEPDTDAGRAAIIARLEAILADARGRLPTMFHPVTVAPVTVRRMPIGMEAGSPGAFYNGGTPATFSINLRATADQPLWRLPTLAHHEGIPGHHFQASALDSAGALPPFRRLVRFSAYTEGWALYAEQLADEMGCYSDDPVGRIGYLQSMLFRAARIVVDTGIHHKRWTRAAATNWMVEHAGESPIPAQREIDRYCVYPGQACSFKVGQTQIAAAREAARARMGDRFDVRAFHDIVLLGGPMPMQTLAAAVDRWAAA
ncbi:DUF885 domain-containing protein [Polymorphobacter fuscus]|uniref:DUF885 family protein n=1 Tax=Sandarakinorhabdus fusca TaxID=1439888 RepID=A0A7C9GM73_9SPHN|nr:DUF885 family protein [Polymorphobacter fuscus]KAB7648264.1 DUF885 domain-containing protein [Polymorphobacter fuscus]MQT15772.1 DUF885 family protein [Polymorphobacter fuscus]NJC07956.1 uncharacterized protein (DUF885 family) [Polymorphobacter fuscus]